MKIYSENLSDVDRYIENHDQFNLDHYIPSYNSLISQISRFKDINSESELIEIGTGKGWFPILCNKNGLKCKGLEISPQLVEYAKEFGKSNGIESDIELGNIEEIDLGDNKYDVIIAQSVFEHVEYWKLGLDKIYKALKPNGILYFSSTNKFSFRSGEFNFPLYGWLPDALRYRLRIKKQGEDIMKLGIDFHQFTHPKLEKYFEELGFREIYDRLDLIDINRIKKYKSLKKAAHNILSSVSMLRQFFLAFKISTFFICIK